MCVWDTCPSWHFWPFTSKLCHVICWCLVRMQTCIKTLCCNPWPQKMYLPVCRCLLVRKRDSWLTGSSIGSGAEVLVTIFYLRKSLSEKVALLHCRLCVLAHRVGKTISAVSKLKTLKSRNEKTPLVDTLPPLCKKSSSAPVSPPWNSPTLWSKPPTHSQRNCKISWVSEQWGMMRITLFLFTLLWLLKSYQAVGELCVCVSACVHMRRLNSTTQGLPVLDCCWASHSKQF